MVYIEHSKSSEQWHSILHSHSFTELFYVTKGHGRMKFNDSEIVHIKQDDLIIVNPNVFHTEYCDINESMEYFVIGIEGIGFDRGQNHNRYSVHNFKNYKHDVHTYLQLLQQEIHNKDTYYEEIIKRLLEILIMNILKHSNTTLNVSNNSFTSNKYSMFIENYINENYHLDITLDTLAQKTHLDKYYLSHLFKDHSGMAPIEYLHHVRIEKSIKLLTTSDFTISYIASMIGFSNAAYFSQFFKKKTAMSPSEYRKQYHISLK